VSELYQNDLSYIAENGGFAGIDEAGRGALAGPVVIASVVLDYNTIIDGLNDSKLLSPKMREALYEKIVGNVLAYCIIEMSPAHIDKNNILRSTIKGFYKAFMGLQPPAQRCLIDGPYIPYELKGTAFPIIKGDQIHAAIAAASILAKVHRDHLMIDYDNQYPEYGFADNKGYGTAHHCKMIHSFGPCPIHRHSFKVPALS